MNNENYAKLEDSATERLAMAEAIDQIRRMETRDVVHATIEDMKAAGEALTLSDEEMRLLESFRRFKLRMRKNGEVFTWQTRKPEGVQLVSETAEIIHPSEAGRG